MNRTQAPFTESQVKSITGFQYFEPFHPLCCMKEDRGHSGGAKLVASRRFLYCPHQACDYKQFFAYEFQSDWSWAEMLINPFYQRLPCLVCSRNLNEADSREDFIECECGQRYVSKVLDETDIETWIKIWGEDGYTLDFEHYLDIAED